MRLSLIQMSSGASDSAANVAKACDFIDLAAKDRPDLIVTPEYFNTGYFPMYRDVRNYARAERDDGPSMRAVKDKARQHKTHIAATLIEEEALGLFFNTTMLVDPDGEIVGKYRKMHPPAQHSLEKIYYRYGANFRVFPVAGFNVSFLICFDFGFPETSRCAMLNGAELISRSLLRRCILHLSPGDQPPRGGGGRLVETRVRVRPAPTPLERSGHGPRLRKRLLRRAVQPRRRGVRLLYERRLSHMRPDRADHRAG